MARAVTWTRSVWVTLLLLVLTGVVKAHLHFIKLVALAGAGLAGMYMMHLLAQDWVKIRPNRPTATRFIQSVLRQGISKRSIPEELDERLNELPLLEEALHQDPLGCARKLVCTLAARPRATLRPEERTILAMVRAGIGRRAGLEFEEALEVGARSRKQAACDLGYRKCRWSGNQLLRILSTFS